jgi:formate dehydrogenase maturation protein FdhE
MRLIDADALKEAVNHKKVVGRFNTIQLIDNAPTVEYTFEEAFQKTVCENKLYCPSRPQGEWITRTEDNGVNYRFYCSCCDREVMLITDYCPYCGADMRGGAEE